MLSKSHVFEWLAKTSHRWPRAGAIALVVVIILGALLASGTIASLDPGGFAVVDSEVDSRETQLAERFGQPRVDLLLTVSAADGSSLAQPSEGADRRARTPDARLGALIDELRGRDELSSVVGPGEMPGAWSIDGRAAVLLVSVAGTDVQQQHAFPELEQLVDAHEAETELDIMIGGRLAANVVAQRKARSDLLRAEMIALPLALVLLLVFFRRLLPAVLPMLIGGFSITATLLALRGLAALTPLSLFALNIVVFLGLGLSIDYSLFVVERFRDELSVGNSPRVALRRTLVSAGKTVAFSGAAVVVSLLALAWIPIEMLRSMAVAGALVVVLSNVGALLILPCLLALFAERLRPKQRVATTRTRRERVWEKIAVAVLRRPGIVFVVVVALLLGVGSPLLHMQTATTDARAFGPNTEIHAVADLLGDPERFAVDPSNAHRLLVTTDDAAGFASPAALEQLDAYATQLREVEGVVELRGLHEGLAQTDAETLAQVLAAPEQLPPEQRAQIDAALDGQATVVTVLSALPATSPAAREQLDALLAAAPPSLEVEAAGRTARASELQSALYDRIGLAVASVALASFLVLVLAFGAPVVALKAVVVNALSLSASFGALVWVFQAGRFEGLLDYQAIGTIDPTVPVMMFALVFGLSMDYELFLLSHIREAYEREHNNERSVIAGLAKTGPIISTAALILIVVVASLVTGTLTFIKQLGLGMALAIFVDASLIRIALVPTTMTLLGRANWWQPGWLARARAWLGVELREDEATLESTPGPKSKSKPTSSESAEIDWPATWHDTRNEQQA